MAPEVHLEWPYGPQADVFSFGCVLAKDLTLRQAFAGHPVKDKIIVGCMPVLPTKGTMMSSSA
jgi:hypothetical protein